MQDSTYYYWFKFKFTRVLHYYPFVVNLDRYVGDCDTLNDLSSKVSVPNKIKNATMATRQQCIKNKRLSNYIYSSTTW